MQNRTVKMLMRLLALVGLLTMVVGVFVPLICSEDDGDCELVNSAGFSLERFDEQDEFGVAMQQNIIGILLLIVIFSSLYSVVTFRGLLMMCLVALFHLSLWLFVITESARFDETELEFGWLLLYGGLGLMFIAWLVNAIAGGRGGGQPQPYGYYAQPPGYPPDPQPGSYAGQPPPQGGGYPGQPPPPPRQP